MKLSKKFIEDLHKIGEDAFIEKNQWIGKLVPDIIIDNLKKRGINQEDIEGCVVLTVEEAKELEAMTYDFLETFESQFKDVDEWNRYVKLHQLLKERIEQTEK